MSWPRNICPIMHLVWSALCVRVCASMHSGMHMHVKLLSSFDREQHVSQSDRAKIECPLKNIG